MCVFNVPYKKSNINLFVLKINPCRKREEGDTPLNPHHFSRLEKIAERRTNIAATNRRTVVGGRRLVGELPTIRSHSYEQSHTSPQHFLMIGIIS